MVHQNSLLSWVNKDFEDLLPTYVWFIYQSKNMNHI